MIQACRAEDGNTFDLGVTLWDLERNGNLEVFLEEKTGVEVENILAYLADGRRLKDENIRDLAGVEDQTIYVFNKRYLDLELEQVLRELHEDPVLQPLVEDTIDSTPPFRISQLAASYLNAAHAHHEHTKRTVRALHNQHTALHIASSALDLHVLAIADVFDGISVSAQSELDKQAQLLAGIDADLEIISRVTIHKQFMSPSMQQAMEAGERGRTLGDYVSRAKMRQVTDSCRKTHEQLQTRFMEAQDTMSRLRQGTDEVRAFVGDQSLLDEADACLKRSQEALDKTAELDATMHKPVAAPEKFLQELRQLDSTLRSEVQFIIQVKNSHTSQCIEALRRISTLNNDLVDLPPSLTALQTGFKAKTSLSHIQRLHSMLYAYGATVVEVVRRKEFARFFYQRAQSFLEIMAKLSANERKRRQVYRGDVHGQLPFETQMDDPVPTIDFSPTGSTESRYSLERSGIDDLLRVLDDLEHFAKGSNDSMALSSVQEARAGLDKLISKMDTLESGFDKIAERSLLSSSRLTTQRRRLTGEDIELELEVQELRQAQAEQEATFRTERNTLEEEISRLRNALCDEEAARSKLERDLHVVRAQLESESTSRRIMEERNAELSTDANGHRVSLARALSEATEQAKAAELVRQELAQVRAEFKHVKAIEKRNADKVASLLEEQALSLARLEEARARGEDLETQIKDARAEGEEVKRALVDAGREKDRLLRAQATEHDRLLRDHIAEADGDRAVLEHQFSELKAALEDTDRQLKDARAQAEMALADTVGLREELQRVEHELREARHVERVLRDDLRDGRASQSDHELRLESSNRLVAQILDVALAFRESHVKALMAAQAMSIHPAVTKVSHTSTLGESSLSPGRLSVLSQFGEPPPIDPSDPTAALEALRAFDHDHFLEAINKAGSTIRKWQRQCKEYRERAKGKISFRNFAKGDLALFLPTRNSISKPWAAFNVSFPHYFLSATGHLAEQLKTREWIVARITSITEQVVDHKDPSTNPYGLGDGIKYYMLEVEDWTQPAYPTKRRELNKRLSGASERRESTSPPISSPPISSPPISAAPIQQAEALPAGPPEPEVEDTFATPQSLNSRLFSGNARVSSSPTAGPSSLSRILAQASSPEMSLEPTIAPSGPTPPRPRSSSPMGSPTPSPRVAPPSDPPGSIRRVPSAHGPPSRRPGSRASRVSTSSLFSSGRIPFGNSTSAAKAVATTAISEQAIATAPTTVVENSAESRSSTPSPEGSPSEDIPGGWNSPNPLFGTGTGITGVSASSRLASLANSWGVTFGRRKQSDTSPTMNAPSAATPATPNPISPSHVQENSRFNIPGRRDSFAM